MGPWLSRKIWAVAKRQHMFLLVFNWESSVGKVLRGSGVLSKWVTCLDLTLNPKP